MAAAVDAYLSSFYTGLLNNQAVSGLTLQVHWDTLNPNAPGDAGAYFWNYVDEAFSSVESWNSLHQSQTPKTIQLVVAPGFNSPQWMLNELASCDLLFQDLPLPPKVCLAGCGEVTFSSFDEQDQADGRTVLPLPWNTTYQAGWKTFLQALAARYGDKRALVSGISEQ
jgi:hypothetical protein